MAERKWTPAQQSAIDAGAGEILVSAAAGSGKTAVLVERAVKLLCRADDPVAASELLLVTFSNAAAGEMRQRIAARIGELARENPSNLHLRRQQSLIGCAQISTVHSFCLELVRQNFHNLPVSPDFRIIDEKELDMLKADCLSACIAAFYERGDDPVFYELVELLASGRDDARLGQAIAKLYDFGRSHPFFDEWLAESLSMYDPAVPVETSVWGAAILRDAGAAAAHCLGLTRSMLTLLATSEAAKKAYRAALQSDEEQLAALCAALENGGWDDCHSVLREFAFARLGALRGEDAIKARVQNTRKYIKDAVQGLRDRHFCATRAEYREDIGDLRAKIALLFEMLTCYSDLLAQAKSDRKCVDFSDLEHLAIALLVEREGGEHRLSVRAQEIRRRYRYVLVDEYQDTNEAQELIFSCICGEGGNLFMVGDVKQSIYSFRQAMPQIFMAKKERFYPHETGMLPSKIILGANFRSRKEVTGAVNFLFSLLMSTQMGEIDYGGEEQLHAGASFPAYENAVPELLLTELSDGGEPAVQEARTVAAKIGGMLREGYLVADGDALRRCEPGDFCVLLRSPKSRAEIYARALTDAQIPVWSENAGGFLLCREIAAVVSLLAALDNPLLDVELAGAMMGFLYDFTADDIAQVRICGRGESLYAALLAAAERGNERAAAFLADFSRFRRLAATLTADELLLKIYEATRATAFAAAMPSGSARVRNLELLVEYAADYHGMGYKKLSGFVGFLRGVRERKGDLAPASGGGAANAVRIMSVHRSKGLEFPVVVVADCGKKFNKMDLRENTLLHTRYGFACVRRDYRLRKQFPTVPMQAIRIETLRTMLSEEMRILYVALTRAREKLIISGYVRDAGAAVAKLYSPAAPNGKLAPHGVGGGDCYLDWVLMALPHHESASALRSVAELDADNLLDDGNPWAIEICTDTAEQDTAADRAQAQEPPPPDPALVAELTRRAAFVYPHQAHCSIPSKLSVSDVARQSKDVSRRFTRRPGFLTGQGLSPTERGDAMHKFMQLADYTAARDDLEREIERMRAGRFMSEREADSLDRERLAGFFSGALAQRMFAADALHRELRFTAECGADVVGAAVAGMDEQARVVVQGVADCVFIEDGGAVIVDYKTDRVTAPEQLVERYARQLAVYAHILGESLGVPVRERVIYSFALGREIGV